MASPAALEEARFAFRRQTWAEAHAAYSDLNREGALPLDDIERFAVAAHLLGQEEESREVLAHGYRESLRLDDAMRAARFAFWLAHSLMFAGEMAQSGGWCARARTLLSERGDCAEWGYFMVLDGIEMLEARDPETARHTFTEAQAIGRRFADPDLQAMARHGLGRALIRLGLTGEGMAVLDELMVAVIANEVTPMIVGDCYCGVLEACHEVFDVRRAREWTAALTRWCEGQPDLVPYRGPCLVHRVELMRLRGDWEDALEEARRACDWLSLPASPEGPADAFYQLGELYRVRGDFAAAEDAYRQASRLGRLPEPGLALLWLVAGGGEAARTAVGRALDETADDRVRRSELLAAYVEILLALDDIPAAQAAAAELTDIAGTLNALLLQALADRAAGSVLIAEGDASAALAPLRRSWMAWNKLDAPYEAARTRVVLGAACRALGDEQSAEMELDAARWVFERLGAVHDLARLEAGSAERPPAASNGLTPREVEVLSLIAAGHTNKAIAAALIISEHTVARHVQNMLLKLGFSSRTSLATFAVEQGIAGRSTGQN